MPRNTGGAHGAAVGARHLGRGRRTDVDRGAHDTRAHPRPQTYGVFLSVSHDLLGSRNQVVDSNWVVCDQNVPAGQQVTGDVEGAIDLGVVEREETRP